MVWESWPWKKEIGRTADSLRSKKTQRRWPESSLVRVEKDVFISAYAVRKLLEANKLSDEVESMSLSGTEYASLGHLVHFANRYEIDVLYNLAEGTQTRVSLSDFCNQIIHSFVFLPWIGEDNGLSGLYVTSDRDRSKRLLYFSIDEVVDALDQVSSDEIRSSLVEVRGEEWRMVFKSREKATRK